VKPYDVPAEPSRNELLVVNSRFIASLAPVFSVEEARGFIDEIRAEFADATHNVPAFLIGHGESEIAHCTDAGEPSGTAGRPMLAVLQGSGLGDVCVVVTRYFGGTKLGTGGLVRAYSDAVRSVIHQVPRARKVLMQTVMSVYSYNLIERVRRLAGVHSVETLEETFAADVTLTARLLPEDLPGFQKDLMEISNGTIRVEVIETGTVLKRIN